MAATRRDGRVSWVTISCLERSWDSNPLVQILVVSNQWLKDLYLALPSQTLSTIRIGQGLCWLSGKIILLSGISHHGEWWFGKAVGRTYKVATRANSRNSVPIVIWSYVLPGHQTPTTTPTNLWWPPTTSLLGADHSCFEPATSWCSGNYNAVQELDGNAGRLTETGPELSLVVGHGWLVNWSISDLLALR